MTLHGRHLLHALPKNRRQIIFEIPFRRSAPLSLSNAITNYITSNYDQHPDMFKPDLEAIDRLRTEAINVLEPHVSGLEKLGRYAAQLRWIAGKFPIDIGADFTWYPALGYNTQTPVTQNNLQFEWANVLYNLASLYSKLGATSPRTTTEGIKIANNHFQRAAGVIKHLKDEVIPELRSAPPEDMDHFSLEALENLMLAQAQECFWHKAVVDGNRDALIAKIAEQVSDFFKLAEEFGVKSNAISSEWIHRISAKRYHLAAAAQYRSACDSLEKSKYGDEIARLESAQSNVELAIVESRYLPKTYLGDLKSFRIMLVDNLKRANKDNDMIYLTPVPPASSLTPIAKFKMVKSVVPPEITNALELLTETGAYGRPLFAKLVPYAVHLATSIYAEKRDRLVNDTIIAELESLTTKIHELQESLNLPGSLQALEKPLGLPSGLLAHAEEVRQQDGLKRIMRSLSDIEKLKSNDHVMYRETKNLLESEAALDASMREKHGTVRWTRPASHVAGAKMHKTAEDYSNFLESADTSDKLVRDNVTDCEKMLKILGGDLADLQNFVPDSKRSKMTPRVEREVTKLRACLNEIGRMESSRRRKIEALREKAKNDDITTEILNETARLERTNPHLKIDPAVFDHLFQLRLTRHYAQDQRDLTTEITEQTALTTRLGDANSAFVAARNSSSSIPGERDKALQQLENAYFKYREVISGLDKGRTFYNDLAKLFVRYKEEVRNWTAARRLEARRLDEELSVVGVQAPVSAAVGRREGATRSVVVSPPPPPPPHPSTPPQQRASAQTPFLPPSSSSPQTLPSPVRRSTRTAAAAVGGGGGSGVTQNPPPARSINTYSTPTTTIPSSSSSTSKLPSRTRSPQRQIPIQQHHQQQRQQQPSPSPTPSASPSPPPQPHNQHYILNKPTASSSPQQQQKRSSISSSTSASASASTTHTPTSSESVILTPPSHSVVSSASGSTRPARAAPPSTPGKPTRGTQKQQQQYTPMPGLWTGDGVTPIKFAPPPSGPGAGAGAGKR
ncbi:putative pala protein [Peziza echinospora]|nr:putative pala protein [Peziza echinospora]